MIILNKIISFYYREYKLNLSGFQDILTNIIFFFVSIFIFIFSIGPDKETISNIGIGIVWTLLLLSSTLSLRKFYQDDFENGYLVVLYLNGFSFGFIAILYNPIIPVYLYEKFIWIIVNMSIELLMQSKRNFFVWLCVLLFDWCWCRL